MRAMRLALKVLSRDWKSGELAVLGIALLVAVTSLTAVAFFTDRVGQAVKMRATESLAADLRVQSASTISEQYTQLAAQRGLSTARIVSMPSVVFAGEANTLAAVRGVSDGYPLRGRLKISDHLLASVFETDKIPMPGEAWASTRLLARLGADVGTTIQIGAHEVTVSQVLDYRPDQGWQFVDLAPTVLINDADMPLTGLIQPGSRVRYAVLFAGKEGAVRDFKTTLVNRLHAAERLRDIENANPQLRSAMDRAERFLNLSALISVLLAAVAVAMAARRYASRHLDSIALMKCLGARQAFILQVSILQLLMLALAAGFFGTLLGYTAQAGLTWLLQDFVGTNLPAPGWEPVTLGMVTSVAVLTGFALPGFLQLGRTPPIRVSRHDAGPPPLRYSVSYGAAAAAVALVLYWMVQDVELLSYILVGMLVAIVILMSAGWLLVRLLNRFRGAAGVAWRYGLSNVSRRGRESIVQVVAFGLGLMVLLLLTVVRNDLMTNWRASLPEDAPNNFLINIQPYEVPGLKTFFEERGLDVPEFVPLVRARMTEISGKNVAEIAFENPDGRQWARRDSNLTWAANLQTGNEIVDGKWWDKTNTEDLVSVEQRFATDLGVSIGDTVTFDVAGESVTAKISSIRTVKWDSFQPNFFMVYSPGVLDEYPATYISSLRITPENRGVVVDLMREHPSVTVIDLDSIMTQVRDVMDKAALAVQAVFLFTLIAGLTVLLAAVQSTRDERRYESAVLRTLGAKRRLVLTGVAVEFTAIGLLAGVLAAFGASAAGYLMAENLFRLDYNFSFGLWLAGLFSGMLLVGVAGTLATRSVVNQAPVSTLRGL